MESFSPERFSLLIVDDIGHNLQLLETILERAKYRVVRATNGERALEQIERKAPDLILLDLMMPGMDGLQVCRILKADDRYREIPIIFLTANNESKNLIEAFQSGAVDYITKPFNVLELLARVKTHLELKHAKDQLQQALRELEQLVLTDPLTRVSNRRHLYQVAEMEIARTRGYNYPFSALILDIDRFKQVNDTYGHLVGDEVLQSVASIVKNTLRQEDCLARFGGEEFVVLLPHTDSSGAIAVANRIRDLIASSSIVIGGKEIAVTASIGVATFGFDDRDLDDLLNRADEALLNAKRQGRDRCVLHLANLDSSAVV
ncbi:diguanylate cyclase [Pannus brasiliensis CCIBt3594]|uniref:Diguanylate cyclase n=1 Tax=Pannus brasiliensis CCIBt3594 TaxID=1427578 RepID=A0AAW9QU39_9CHRO